MKKISEQFNLLRNRNKSCSIIFNKKNLVLFIMITILFGCSSTVQNIKSPKELNENKLLIGRFVFFNNDIPFENSDDFKVFFKKKQDNKLRVFKPDQSGYVYIPVDEGQYYISVIEYRDFQGQLRIPIQQSHGINIKATDTVVNFGTIKVSLEQDESSKIAYLSKYAYPYAGKFIPSSHRPDLKITQVSQWNVVRKYVSSKLEALDDSIRNEVIRFAVKAETSIE